MHVVIEVCLAFRELDKCLRKLVWAYFYGTVSIV